MMKVLFQVFRQPPSHGDPHLVFREGETERVRNRDRDTEKERQRGSWVFFLMRALVSS